MGRCSILALLFPPTIRLRQKTFIQHRLGLNTNLSIQHGPLGAAQTEEAKPIVLLLPLFEIIYISFPFAQVVGMLPEDKSCLLL